MSAVLPAAGDPPPPGTINAAVEALRGGDIVAVPTDTVYGLAADPWHSGAADRLFRLKGRPRHVELPLLVSGPAQALQLATAVTDQAHLLMERFWPGALTIVLPRRPDVAADLGEDEATIGLRCPAHPVPLALCRELGPIATTSANHHGQAPATTVAEVLAQVPGVTLVLDGGACTGMSSSVVDATGADLKLLRAGRVPWEDIQAACGLER
jgi:L-threonylcarbamoyladenylate synthase